MSDGFQINWGFGGLFTGGNSSMSSTMQWNAYSSDTATKKNEAAAKARRVGDILKEHPGWQFYGFASPGGRYAQGEPVRAYSDSPVFYRYFEHEGFWFYARHMPPEYQLMKLEAKSHQKKLVKLEAKRMKVLERIAQEREEMKVNGMVVNNFLVGCDPEFIAVGENNQIVHLNDYLPVVGAVGLDHGGRVGEIRPDPAKHTYTLLGRIQKLVLDERMRKIPAKRIRGGALVLGQAIGGHIHLAKDPYTMVRLNGYDQAILCTEHKAIIQALDNVTKRLEHLDILPSKEVEGRRQTGFGKYSEARYDHAHRFEYRTMPSWLYHPHTAYICLTAAKLAAAYPDTVAEAMKIRTEHPWTRLKEWFDIFKDKDSDAARVREKVFAKGLKACQRDPEVDIREQWENLGV